MGSFDPRIKKDSFVILVGPSGSGKTTAVAEILKNSKHFMEQEVGHVVLITKHPNQKPYMDIVNGIKNVSFLTPEADMDEQWFLEKLNLQPGIHTTVLFDDVSFLSTSCLV